MMNRQLFCKATRSLEFINGTIPQLNKTGVIVKVHYTGICHSDANTYADGENAFLPIILGHEIAGTIYAIGEDVKEKLVIGQRVVVYPWGGCRDCEYCRRGNQNCPHRYGPHAHTYGLWKHGGFQEYMLVENSYCIMPVPDDIPLDIACLVPCSGITGYNAVENCKDSIKEAIRFKGKANVMFMGVGGVGLWAVESAKNLYGDSVTVCAVDLFEQKLEDAKKAGADKTLLLSKTDNKETTVEKLRSVFNDGKDKAPSGLGSGNVDAAVDFVNSSMTLECLSNVMTTGGTIVVIGIHNRYCPPIDVLRLILDCIRIQGSCVGSKKQVTEIFELIRNKKIKGPLVQHTIMDDIESVMAKMADGELIRGRVVVEYVKDQS